MVKQLLKNWFDSYYKRKLYIPDPEVSLHLLKNMGFSPAEVFDVGAYNGEFAKMINGIWPQAKVVCFEALPEKLTLLHQKYSGNDQITIVKGLVGERDDDNVRFHEVESASSVLEEHTNNNFKVGYHQMMKLDTYVANTGRVPDLLKLDTQGYEYNILKGLENHLKQCKVILAELNFVDIHKNVKLAHEVIELLAENDFIIFDICQLHRKPSDKVLWQADFLFVKKDSPLRQNKTW